MLGGEATENENGAESRSWLADLANASGSPQELGRIAKESTARWCASRDQAAIAKLRASLIRENRDLQDRLGITQGLPALSAVLNRHAVVLGSLDALGEQNESESQSEAQEDFQANQLETAQAEKNAVWAAFVTAERAMKAAEQTVAAAERAAKAAENANERATIALTIVAFLLVFVLILLFFPSVFPHVF